MNGEVGRRQNALTVLHLLATCRCRCGRPSHSLNSKRGVYSKRFHSVKLAVVRQIHPATSLTLLLNHGVDLHLIYGVSCDPVAGKRNSCAMIIGEYTHFTQCIDYLASHSHLCHITITTERVWRLIARKCVGMENYRVLLTNIKHDIISRIINLKSLPLRL